MRWAHSAVDYLAAAVGGDMGAGWGAVGERVVGNPPCAHTHTHTPPPPPGYTLP